MMEPILGMKLSANSSSAETRMKSISKIHIQIAPTIAVAALIHVLVIRYFWI